MSMSQTKWVGVLLMGFFLCHCQASVRTDPVPTDERAQSPGAAVNGLNDLGSAAPDGVQSRGHAEFKRLALLVGVGDYDKSPGVPEDLRWTKLDGPPNDVQSLAQELRLRGFDTMTLINEEATGDAIRQATQSHLINQISSAQDIVLFYFAGHGQQIVDEDGDEFDGCDESIVPFDNKGTMDSSGHLSDDALGEMFEPLRTRTDNLVIILDSCHSGTATRGHVKRRGGPPAGGVCKQHQGEDSGLIGSKMRERGGYVLLSAAAANQPAAEMRHASLGNVSMGVFTRLLVEALQETRGRAVSYRRMIERINVRMGRLIHGQQAQLEGEDEDQRKEVLGGRVFGHKPSFRVHPYQGEGVIRIDAGTIHGINEGAEVAVFSHEEEAFDPDNALARVTLKDVELSQSEGALSSPSQELAEALADGAQAIEVSSMHAVEPFKVHIDPSLRSFRAVLEQDERMKFIEIVSGRRQEDWSVSIEPDPRQPGSVWIPLSGAAGDDDGFVPIPVASKKPMVRAISTQSPDFAQAIIQALDLHFQRQNLISMTSPQHTRVDVTLRVDHVKWERDRSQKRGYRITDRLKVDMPKDGSLPLGTQQNIQFHVTNHSPRRMYFAILTLGSDGSIGPSYPYDTQPGETYVEGKSELAIDLLFGTPAFAGTMYFKLIATEKPVDFKALTRQVRSERLLFKKRGSVSRLQRLFENVIADYKTRNVEPIVIEGDDEWGTDLIKLRIVTPQVTP